LNRKEKGEIKSPNAAQNIFSDWGILKPGAPQGSILWSLALTIYINDLPLIINFLSEIMFADDISVIISKRNFGDFCTTSNLVPFHMIEWFAANKLHYINMIKFVTNNSPHCAVGIGYKEKYIEQTANTNFPCLHTDNCLNWKIILSK
jgi:hypothetical protein